MSRSFVEGPDVGWLRQGAQRTRGLSANARGHTAVLAAFDKTLAAA
jgi:PPE-repeat protein